METPQVFLFYFPKEDLMPLKVLIDFNSNS